MTTFVSFFNIVAFPDVQTRSVSVKKMCLTENVKELFLEAMDKIPGIISDSNENALNSLNSMLLMLRQL